MVYTPGKFTNNFIKLDYFKTMLNKTLWSIHGLRHYTASDFVKKSKNFVPLSSFKRENPLNIWVTGANSGIGLAIAESLCKLDNVNLTIICRDENRGESALSSLKKSIDHSSTSVQLKLLDIAKPKDIVKFGKDLIDKEAKINVLINNAGYLATKYERYEDTEYETSFVTNVIGTKLLTESLLPYLTDSSDINNESRVITVSSGSALPVLLNIENPAENCKICAFNGLNAGMQQKRQLIHLQELFQKKHPHIRFVSMHPGWVDTPGVEKSMPSFYSMMRTKLRTPEQGADTAVFLAIDNKTIIGHDKSLASLYFDREVSEKFYLKGASPSQISSESERVKKNLDIFGRKLDKICDELTNANN